MLGIPLNKGDIHEIHVAHRLALIHSTVVAVQTYNLSSKLLTQAHQLSLQERHFPTPLRHCRKTAVVLKLSNVTFAKFFTSFAKI